MTSDRLHLYEASLQTQDSDSAQRKDVDRAVATGADIIGFTEMNDVRTYLNTRPGYRHITFPQNTSGESFLIKTGIQLITRRTQRIHRGTEARPRSVFISWIKVRWKGEIVWVHICHWAAKVPGRAAGTGPITNTLRTRQHTLTTNTMSNLVKKHATGGAISFFMGDINIDEAHDNQTDDRRFPNQIFRQNGLLTIWDEFKVTPNTFGAQTYDVIGRFKNDTQVKGARYRVHHPGSSDHRPVSAYYDVTHTRGTTVGGGTDGHAPTPTDKGYITGGNISWDDYMDDELYELPFAVDDSDDHDHG